VAVIITVRIRTVRIKEQVKIRGLSSGCVFGVRVGLYIR